MRFGALQIRKAEEEFLGLCAPPYREQHIDAPSRLWHRAKQMDLLGIDCSNSGQARPFFAHDLTATAREGTRRVHTQCTYRRATSSHLQEVEGRNGVSRTAASS